MESLPLGALTLRGRFVSGHVASNDRSNGILCRFRDVAVVQFFSTSSDLFTTVATCQSFRGCVKNLEDSA